VAWRGDAAWPWRPGGGLFNRAPNAEENPLSFTTTPAGPGSSASARPDPMYFTLPVAFKNPRQSTAGSLSNLEEHPLDSGLPQVGR
jgi:hypothetical protein